MAAGIAAIPPTTPPAMTPVFKLCLIGSVAPSGHGGGRVVTSTNVLDGNGMGSFSIRGGRFLRGIEGRVEERVNQSRLAQARLALTCMAALTR